MARDVHQIRIDSILGGQSQLSNLSGSDQFLSSLAIDPSVRSSIISQAGGILSPVLTSDAANTLSASPMWMKQNPKDANIYVYDNLGSVYTVTGNTPPVVTAIADGGSMSNGTGNGCAYYDNYMYFAKNTTIARYGPLNGTPAFDGNYWTTTLGKTALADTTYPSLQSLSGGDVVFPNHVMHRHSDGRLYIADVVGNQGTIHYISTQKTTVEGDTDNGSTYGALTFGNGLWPTAIESYGSLLVIALAESDQLGTIAKLAFWDTSSTNFNSIIFEELPDKIITALKNVNGVLYIISARGQGFRLSRYIGGYSVEQIKYFDIGFPPLPGAVDGEAGRLIFGSQTLTPEQCGTVYSFGLKNPVFSEGLFNVFRTPSAFATVTALTLRVTGNFHTNYPFVGWRHVTDTAFGEITQAGGISGSSTTAPSLFWSQLFKIGSPFKITRIIIPLDTVLGTGNSVIPTIYMDNGTRTKTLTTISSANFGSNTKIISIRPEDCAGDYNFYLELRWTGNQAIAVSLPITIEYELKDIETSHP